MQLLLGGSGELAIVMRHLGDTKDSIIIARSTLLIREVRHFILAGLKFPCERDFECLIKVSCCTHIIHLVLYVKVVFPLFILRYFHFIVMLYSTIFLSTSAECQYYDLAVPQEQENILLGNLLSLSEGNLNNRFPQYNIIRFTAVWSGDLSG